MVDVADPKSVHGRTVVQLIERFFGKHLQGDAAQPERC